MIKKIYTNIFKGSAVYLLVTFLLVSTLNACGAKPSVVISGQQPAATITPRSMPDQKTYDWNGIKFYLNVPLPEAPEEMKVYLAKDEVPATADTAKALAKQFGMNGEIYQAASETDNGTEYTDYLVMDGNQQLRVRSDRYFTYYPNIVGEVTSLFLAPSENPNAEALIHEFMKAHGFNFKYEIERKQVGIYSAFPFTPNGIVLQYAPFDFNGLTFLFDENGIRSVSASLIKYDESATVGIIGAEEALQKFIKDSSGNGWIIGDSSQSLDLDQIAQKMWFRPPLLEKTVAYFGELRVMGKSISDGKPLITLDGYTVTGNIQGLITATILPNYVEAIGKFHDTDGVKTFELESWKIFEENVFQHGTIQREGEQVVINNTEDKKLILPDFPNDLALPAENMTVEGATHDGVLDWKRIANYAFDSGGGGGGGGGHYKINLTGTPVPFLTPTLAPTPTLTPFEASLPKPVEGLRGRISITIFQHPDGSQNVIYSLTPQSKEYQGLPTPIRLEGDLLQGLQNYNNRPIDVWGMADFDKNGALTIKVKRYEIPYPNLKFQLVKGRQKPSTINGQSVVLFTTEDNQTYIQFTIDGSPFNLSGNKGNGLIGNLVVSEALVIPDETFGGYPALRSFFENPVNDPTTGKPYPFTPKITDDQPEILPMDKPATTATIEKIDLVYFTPDKRFIYPDPNLKFEPPYVQPVWRFYGHYDNGNKFEILVQALKDKFLLPETQDW